jgi:hypothetical protein
LQQIQTGGLKFRTIGEIKVSYEHIQKSVTNVINYLTENPEDALANDPPIIVAVQHQQRSKSSLCDWLDYGRFQQSNLS